MRRLWAAPERRALHLRGQALTVALVTGAAKRLGREMALYLARRGYDVAVHYASSRVEAEALAQDIRALGRRSGVFAADLLVEAEVQALIPKVRAELGALSLLVNNASIFEYDSITNATRESWDRHLESNLRAPYVLTQHFARLAVFDR